VEGGILTFTDKSRLAELETRIEACRRSFIGAGEALREIRESRLYRDSHATFEFYCLDRWQLTPRHSNRLIAAADVVRLLGPIGPILPTTESQARELTRLDTPALQLKAWEGVVARTDGTAAKITAEVVREEVSKLLPEKADSPFIPAEEAEVIRAWLAKRVKAWPEQYRDTFENFIGGIVDSIVETIGEEPDHEDD
jgi:hypothetical protein